MHKTNTEKLNSDAQKNIEHTILNENQSWQLAIMADSQTIHTASLNSCWRRLYLGSGDTEQCELPLS